MPTESYSLEKTKVAFSLARKNPSKKSCIYLVALSLKIHTKTSSSVVESQIIQLTPVFAHKLDQPLS